MPTALDPIHAALGAAALLAAAIALYFRSRVSAQAARAAAAEAELKALKEAPLKLEYRLDNFGVLWFPLVTASAAAKEVLSVTPGLPHCKACVRPLSAAGADGQWVCRQCQAHFPATLVDIHVTDIISKEALRCFQERHPDWTTKARRYGPKPSASFSKCLIFWLAPRLSTTRPCP